MSFQAKFRLDEDYGNEMVVLAADYAFSQPMDSQNLPNGKPKAGIVSVTLASGKDNKIIEWMVSPKMTKFVQIIFKGKDGSTIRLVELTNTYCVGFREIFDANDSNPMKMLLTLSAWDIRINIIYGKTNDWAEFESSRSGANIADSSATPPSVGSNGEDTSVTYQNDVPAAPEVPEAPEVPAVPEAPAVPDVPEVPKVPDPPAIPDAPGVPEMPAIPEVPEVPAIPDAPAIPDMPDVPTVPDVPSVPDLPEPPSIPDIPSPPNLPEPPKIPSPPEIPEPPTVPSFIP